MDNWMLRQRYESHRGAVMWKDQRKDAPAQLTAALPTFLAEGR